MTVIAWDGKTLAADRLYTDDCDPYEGTKIFRYRRELLAVSGTLTSSIQLMDWYRAGAKREHYPPRPEHHATLWIIRPNGSRIEYTTRTPVPITHTEHKGAMGCGYHLALGAMAMGADARKAVLVACAFNVHCGLGVDTLQLR